VLVATYTALEAQVQALDAEIAKRAKADPVARRLMTVPGIGPIAAAAITASCQRRRASGQGEISPLGWG
jgi:transposase